ncbi:uncharacterized protein LOC141703782 [Apium graveolens]|uniref:uncharacterized protein LOC141703782 n=1 Tax=Apium graveolens TaxID=4045 RepID=UPI003D78CA80
MDPGKNKDGAVSLSYPMLTRANYTAWALKMKVYMQAHGVWDAIVPKDPKTVVEDKVDKIAMATIYQSIPEDILLSVVDKETTKDTWDAVKVMCKRADRVKKARVQTLKSEFESMSMKDSDSLDDFCLKISALVTNIRALGEEVVEAYVVKKILRAVPPKFLQIASTIEQFGDLEKMTMDETVGFLKAHEERLDEWIKRSNKGGSEQKKWGKESNRGGYKSRVRCFNCNLLGHYAAECRRPKRDKESNEEVNIAQIPDDEPALLLTKREGEKERMMLVNEDK